MGGSEPGKVGHTKGQKELFFQTRPTMQKQRGTHLSPAQDSIITSEKSLCDTQFPDEHTWGWNSVISHIYLKLSSETWNCEVLLAETCLGEVRTPCLPSPPETLCWQMGTFACVLVLNVALGHISSIWETKFTPVFHRHCRVLSQLWP